MKTTEMMAESVIEKSKMIIKKRNKRNRMIGLLTLTLLLSVAVVTLAMTSAARNSNNPLPLPEETTAAATTENEKTAETDADKPETSAVTATETDTETTADVTSAEEETNKHTETDDVTTSEANTHIDKNKVLWANGSVEEDFCTGEWYGKTVHGSLYEVLMQPDVIIAVQFVPYIEEDFVYNGKTYAEYRQEALDETEAEILATQRYNAFKQSADMYIRIGKGKETDLGEYGWKLTWYDNMTEFFGEEFLSKYIENDIPLFDKLEEDMKHLPTTAHDELNKARAAYLETALREVEEMMKSQNIEYSLKDDTIIIFVTAEEFKTIELGKYAESDFFWAARYGQNDDM